MIDNIEQWWAASDTLDREIGADAYENYSIMMARFAQAYGVDVARVTAAFCALSPNSDYFGNLRSLVSVLEYGQEATVSTYKHCRDRACSYLLGEPFETPKRGLKILSFYKNIRDPADPEPVTIDGHMAAIYHQRPTAKMKDWAIGRREYLEMAAAFRAVALRVGLRPNQLQATLWHTRKRVLGIKFDPHRHMFQDAGRILFELDEVQPYENTSAMQSETMPGEAEPYQTTLPL